MSKTEEISSGTMQRDTESTPKAHRKHNENSGSSHGFLKIPQATETLIPSVWTHPARQPHQPIPPARRPTETTDTSHVEAHE